ncbi:hypothetical protein [uncultured Massilia sp.]|uniref:hypothetical protein n=1 Tax=uncultured Massilia sp. TaxID=169973 RepID=UPI0025DDDCDB|nr:hypothetical protein [uncultured Massilia sp.]
MTTQSTIGPPHQHLEGRTVRDIVEYSPDQVDEPWCRRIFRQVLQSLELQYAMRMPHRPITPDTIVFHENGEPLLVPTPGAAAEGDEAGDLNALARVVHYAVTRELAPAGPLRGRAPGYSEALVTAVDRCMAPAPAERPQTVEALRNLLGIVPLGPPVTPAPAIGADAAIRPAPHAAPHAAASGTTSGAAAGAASTAPSSTAFTAAAPMDAPAAVPSQPSSAAAAAMDAAVLARALAPASGRGRRWRGLARWQRWAVAGGAGAVLLALALAVFAELRDASSFDRIVLTLPQAGEAHGPAAPPGDVPAPAGAAAAGSPQPANPAGYSAGYPAEHPVENPAANAGTHPAAPARAAAAPAADGNAYKLLIQPWGVVYVDGVDRGVSPPVKRLVLAPGRHTVRIANPNFHDRVLEIDTAAGGDSIAVDFNEAAP